MTAVTAMPYGAVTANRLAPVPPSDPVGVAGPPSHAVTLPATDPSVDPLDGMAACSDLGVDLFFSDDFDDIAAAKLLCLQCPVRDRCLDAAVQRGEQYGVWGGQLFDAGRIVIAKRRRGRPTKVARPQDSLPEVALPALYRRLAIPA